MNGSGCYVRRRVAVMATVITMRMPLNGLVSCIVLERSDFPLKPSQTCLGWQIIPTILAMGLTIYWTNKWPRFARKSTIWSILSQNLLRFEPPVTVTTQYVTAEYWQRY